MLWPMTMTHKQRKQSGIIRKTPIGVNDKKISDEYGWKPILYGSENVTLLAIESGKARLLLDSVEKQKETSREFSSYFHAPRASSNAVYVVTSHTAPPYNSDQKLYNIYPPIEDKFTGSAIEEYPNKYKLDLKQPRSWNRCTTSTDLLNYTQRELYGYTENIIQFCDTSTMTPKLDNASLCDSVAQTSSTLEATTSWSNLFITEPTRTDPFPCFYGSILKKRVIDKTFGQNINSDTSRHVMVVQDSPRCDGKLTDYEDLLQAYQNRSKKDLACQINSQTCDSEVQRKTLYNEGIHDKETFHPLENRPYSNFCPKSNESRQSLNRPYCQSQSRVSLNSNYKPCYSSIPYAHIRSKYHDECIKPNIDKWECEEFQFPQLPKSLASRIIHRKTLNCYERAPIRLPKRVLTSERDIEYFIDKCGIKLSRQIYSVLDIK